MVNRVTLGWCPVTSGVPWDFILSSVLFKIVINNLEAELENKSRDDTSLGGAVVFLKAREALQ